MAEGDTESSFLLIPIAEKNGVANQVGLLRDELEDMDVSLWIF